MSIDSIVRAGGELQLAPNGAPKALTLSERTLDPMLCRQIGELRSLEELSLSGCEFEEADLAFLGNLHCLRYLILQGLYTGRSLAVLENSPIATLRLQSPHLFSENLSFVSSCSKLTVLCLPFVALRVSDLDILERCRSLRVLELGGSAFDGELESLLGRLTQVCEIGLKAIKKITRTSTSFDGHPLWSPPSKLTSSDARSLLGVLARLGKLQRIDLSDWPLGDDCIDELARLPKSAELVVKYTALTPTGLSDLRAARLGTVVSTGMKKREPYFSLRASHAKWSLA